MTRLRMVKGRPPLSNAHGRIADGQCDDALWTTISPEIVDAIPRERPIGLSRGRRRRADVIAQIERNVVIKAAHDRGISQRLLARVFGLPRSVVQEILAGRQTYGRRRDDRDGEP